MAFRAAIIRVGHQVRPRLQHRGHDVSELRGHRHIDPGRHAEAAVRLSTCMPLPGSGRSLGLPGLGAAVMPASPSAGRVDMPGKLGCTRLAA